MTYSFIHDNVEMLINKYFIYCVTFVLKKSCHATSDCLVTHKSHFRLQTTQP